MQQRPRAEPHTRSQGELRKLCAPREGRASVGREKGIPARAGHRTLGATRIDGQLLVAVPAPLVLSDVELCRLAPRARRQSSTHLRPGGCRLYYDAYIWDGVKWWGGARGSAGETRHSEVRLCLSFACVNKEFLKLRTPDACPPFAFPSLSCAVRFLSLKSAFGTTLSRSRGSYQSARDGGDGKGRGSSVYV